MTPSAETLIARMRKAGIRVTVDAGATQYAHTVLRDDGYHVTLGRAYVDGTPEQRYALAAHEIGHIVRGDCLVRDVGQRLANVAQDSQINACLDQDVVRSLNGVTYEAIRAQCPELPEALPGWRPVYDALAKRGHADLAGHACDGTECQAESHERARAQHAATVLRVRADPELRDAASGQLPGIGTYLSRSAPPIPRPDPRVRRILEEVRAVGRHLAGVPRRVRTYSRPGRVEGLRGISRRPQIRLLVAVDVSGSCEHLRPLLGGIGAWLAREWDVRLVAHTDRVHDGPPDTWPGSGGTAYQPVWAYAVQHRMDAICILTDGESYDIEPLPPVPVVWAIRGRKVPLRDCDREVEL